MATPLRFDQPREVPASADPSGPRRARRLCSAWKPLVLSGAATLFCVLALEAQETQVNTYTTSDQRQPAVAALASGGFVVVWASFGSPGADNTGYSVQMRRFDDQGDPLGSQMQVNNYRPGHQQYPDVAMTPSGDFLVVWDSDGSPDDDDSFESIQLQRFASDGLQIGDSFQVNGFTTGRQRRPAVSTPGSSGFFAVVWHSGGSADTDSDGYSIQLQTFFSAGQPLGGPVQVNSYTTSNQFAPDVAVVPGAGNTFVVVWDSFGSSGDSSSRSVQLQRVAFDGILLGAQIQVNTFTTGHQDIPTVSTSPSGDIAVAWQSIGAPGDDDGGSVHLRRFSSDGMPNGAPLQLNTFTTGSQQVPAVARAQGQEFFVAWVSQGSANDSSHRSIHWRRVPDGSALAEEEAQVNTYTSGNQTAPAVAEADDAEFFVSWTSEESAGTDSIGSSIQAALVFAGIFADGFESGDTTAWSTTIP